MGRKKKCTQISKILIYFWKTFSDIFFVFLIHTAFYFSATSSPSFPSHHPVSVCVPGDTYGRWLALRSAGPWNPVLEHRQIDICWLVCPLTHTQEPKEQPKIVFLQQESFLKNHNRILYTTECTCTHTHTHTHENCKPRSQLDCISNDKNHHPGGGENPRRHVDCDKGE